ncbi:MAG TPA: Na+/H+ antiporter NhaA [Acidimicrobiales bacterium]|nr:Na+/H+ antiporter NhaA [Acidimicrobiales bacterium]
MPTTPESTPARGEPRPGRSVPRALQRFLHTESSGAVALLAATVLALAWANSPWKATYETLWHTELTLGLGDVVRAEDLRHLVNEALMAIFFFVVGLEIKQELVAGQLRRWKSAALPVVAAVGGMVVPALIYTAVNVGGEGSRGWGIPMATDIAFALGVLALLGKSIPGSLKVFLLTLAIADDVGAIAIIAVFYSGGIQWSALLVAAALLAGVAALRRARVFWAPGYLILGVGVWVAFYESGVHATLAGVALGLLAPARPLAADVVVEEWSVDLAEEPSAGELKTMTNLAKSTVSVTERLQHMLHPVTSYLIVPLFALANAGVVFEARALEAPGASAVALGVGLGLVVGKIVGVSGAAWLAVRARVGRLPDGVRWPHIVGVAGLAGIGYTVSLFIADLAFPKGELVDAAKLAILAASVVAAVLGSAMLRFSVRQTSTSGTGRASQSTPTPVP